MRSSTAISIALALIVAGCAGSSTPTSPTSAGALTGTWVGSLGFDSTGSMMGAGVTATMMSNATITLTQEGNAFTGAAHYPGYMGGDIAISGTMTGTSATFTMTMPIGSMMTSRTCTAAATGTFDMNDMHTQLHDTYSGTNSCSGAFDSGQISMMHR